MVKPNRTNDRTKFGQKSPQPPSRTDMDNSLELSCPSERASEALRQLDLVAFEIEQAWNGKLLDHLTDDWRGKFERQLGFLNAAIDRDDKEAITRCADAMRRAWWKMDALAREDGKRPPKEAIWVVEHKTHGAVAVYSSAASIADLPKEMPRFSLEELVRLIPSAVFKVKYFWPEAIVKELKQDRPLEDEIPF